MKDRPGLIARTSSVTIRRVFPANIPDAQSTFGRVLSTDNGQTWADVPTPFPETGHLLERALSS
jgi:hypothetical protein